MLRNERLEEIKQRLDRATPGPWEVGITAYGPSVEVDDEQLFIESYGITYPHNPADADLIANAPTDLAALLTELRATTGDLAVAVEVAKERGEATADLRAGIAALRGEWRKEAAQLRLDADTGAYGTATHAVAIVADIRADALDALLRERAR